MKIQHSSFVAILSRFSSRPSLRGALRLFSGGLFAFALGAANPARAQSASVSYTFVDLGPALGQGVPRLAGKDTAAWAINDSRIVVGDGDGDQVGWRYAAGTATQAVTGGSALGINNAGVIVGARGLGDSTSTPNHTETTAAVRVENGALQTIVSVTGHQAVARSISNAGHIVGEIGVFENNTDVAQGFLWFQGTTTLIGAANGNTEAFGVNDAGDVVGVSVKSSAGDGTAFLWRNGTLTYLTNGFSRADDINNHGVIVGNGDAEGAFKYANGTLTRLAQLSGFDRHQPHAINDAGVIVGTAEKSSTFTEAAVVWLNDQPRALSSLVTLPAGWELNEATGINENGDIVGFGTGGGTQRAFLLQAAPALPPADPGRLTNLSILTDITAEVPSFTVGTVIGGAGTSGTKPLLVRAAGPSLTQLGLGGVLPDPKLDFYSGQTVMASNDDWSGAAVVATAIGQTGAFPFASAGSKDSAVFSPTTASGGYSVIVSGKAGASGTVIAEIYDATPAGTHTTTTPRLVDVSVLKQLGAGSTLTLGFTVGGSTSQTVLIRAIGPALGLPPFNIGGVMADPQLTLFNSANVVVASNNDWGGTAELTSAVSRSGAFAVASAASKDAMLVVTLAPGGYTAQASGVGGSSGYAIVEVYEVP